MHFYFMINTCATHVRHSDLLRANNFWKGSSIRNFPKPASRCTSNTVSLKNILRPTVEEIRPVNSTGSELNKIQLIEIETTQFCVNESNLVEKRCLKILMKTKDQLNFKEMKFLKIMKVWKSRLNFHKTWVQVLDVTFSLFWNSYFNSRTNNNLTFKHQNVKNQNFPSIIKSITVTIDGRLRLSIQNGLLHAANRHLIHCSFPTTDGKTQRYNFAKKIS